MKQGKGWDVEASNEIIEEMTRKMEENQKLIDETHDLMKELPIYDSKKLKKKLEE